MSRRIFKIYKFMSSAILIIINLFSSMPPLLNLIILDFYQVKYSPFELREYVDFSLNIAFPFIIF